MDNEKQPEDLTYKSTDLQTTKAYTSQNFFAENAPSNKKLSLIICFAILALAFLIIAVIIFVKALNPESETAEIETVGTVQQPQSASEIIAAYDEKLAAVETNEEKSALYDERADALYSDSDGSRSEELIAQILADAYAAEAAHPTAETAATIAKYETIYGDQSTADYYFQLAAERDPALKTANEGGQG